MLAKPSIPSRRIESIGEANQPKRTKRHREAYLDGNGEDIPAGHLHRADYKKSKDNSANQLQKQFLLGDLDPVDLTKHPEEVV